MYPFTDGSFAIKNAWYVAAWPDEITRTPFERWILNEPVALYRKEDGTPVAIQGRCPHRHFPLGKSQLCGDDVVCGYHGMSFAPDGSCTGIPSLGGKALPGYRIKCYPIVERGLWAWIWTGDPEKADESLIPDMEELGFNTPGVHFRPFYQLEVKCRYQLLNDNLLDLTHIAYLHGTTFGAPENASAQEEREERPGVIRSRRWMRNIEQVNYMHLLDFGYKGNVDRVSGMNFYLPGFHAGLDDTFIPEDHPTRGGERVIMGRVFHAVTPGRLNTTNYFFGMGSTNESGLDIMFEYLKAVIQEDVFASEEIEQMLQRIGGTPPKELLVRSDVNGTAGRRMMQAMIDAENNVITRQ